MYKWCHPILYSGCNHLSNLGLMSIYSNKRDPNLKRFVWLNQVQSGWLPRLYRLFIYLGCSFLGVLARIPEVRRWIFSRRPPPVSILGLEDTEIWTTSPNICMSLANEGRRYIITSSLIGWSHTKITILEWHALTRNGLKSAPRENGKHGSQLW